MGIAYAVVQTYLKLAGHNNLPISNLVPDTKQFIDHKYARQQEGGHTHNCKKTITMKRF